MGVRDFMSNTGRLVRDLWETPDHHGNRYRAEAEQRRRDQFETALCLYDGVVRPFLDRDIDLHYTSPFTRRKRKACAMYFNVLRRIIDGRARTYKEFPKLNGGSGGLAEAIVNGDTWGALIQADRISELCDIAFVQVLPPAADSGYEGFRFECISPDLVAVEWDEYRQDRITRFTVLTEGEGDMGESVTIRTVWTDEELHIYRDQKEVTDEVARAQGLPATGGLNPYGIIPVAVMRPRAMSFGNPWGQMRSDLVSAQRVLNVRLTDLMYLMQLYYSQVVISTSDTKLRDFQVGADRPLILPMDLEGKTGQASYLTPGVDLNAVWGTIKEIVAYMAFNSGLAALWDTSGGIASGESRKVANADLAEIREEKRPAHLRFWKDLEGVCLKVGASLPGITDQRGLRVEFGDCSVYRDPAEEAKEWLDRIRNGITTRAAWYMSENPKATEEEAERAIAENLARERQLASAGTTPLPPVTDFMGERAKKGLAGPNPQAQPNPQPGTFQPGQRPPSTE